MAFPSTSILDDFNRANASTLGSNWSILKSYAGTGDLGIISNAAYNPEPQFDTYVDMYYNVATYGPDCEVYLTEVTEPTADGLVLYLRIQEPTGSYDGYGLGALANNDWEVRRIDNEVSTVLGATATQAIANGDKIGFEAIGDTLKGYIYTGGSWTEVLSRTDAAYGSAGHLGFYATAEVVTWRYDDFGGGTVVLAGGWGMLLSDKRNRLVIK